MSDQLQEFLKKIGIVANNLQLFVEATTHRSYSNEIRETYSYERLEFLGDAVINKCVAEYLFHLGYDEGKMSKLRSQIVESKTLIKAANDIGFPTIILLGKGLVNQVSANIIEDSFEALVGAIFLDQGVDVVKVFIERTIIKFFKTNQLQESTDYKSLFQEALQHYGSKMIKYRHLPEKSVVTNGIKSFYVEVWCDKIKYGAGYGPRLRDAEKAAAKDAYDKLVSTSKLS